MRGIYIYILVVNLKSLVFLGGSIFRLTFFNWGWGGGGWGWGGVGVNIHLGLYLDI